MLNFDLKALDSINQLICTFELTTARLEPGRYRSRFRICATFVELYCLTHTKLNHYLI
jgi:hypothetical protein